MSPLRKALTLLSVLLVAGAGCTDRNEHSVFDPDGGHPKDFIADHGESYRRYPASCDECHGPDLRGGIAGVSCFQADRNGLVCHAFGPGSFIHPAGFGDPGLHGPVAIATPGPAAGLAFCQVCHGADFTGGAVNTPCSRCHGIAAPHPREWRGGVYNHVVVDQGNAAACAVCHLKAGAGGTPGCFNDTLCHAQRDVHPGGWELPQNHGDAAKEAPAARAGFAWCTSCHGDDFEGGEPGVDCTTECHEVDAPHPAEWLSSDTFTHTTTDQGNAIVCADCHRSAGAAGKAGCFNGTLCHGPGGGHIRGFADPDLHGATAKARPSVLSGFSWCQDCHGFNYSGGSAPTCYQAGCHQNFVPHPGSPWRDGRTHTTTHTGNAAVCGLCHRDPNAPPATPPGCFNDTLCHGAES